MYTYKHISENRLTCAFSPCPNDTFIFCHLAKDPNIEIHLHDVETLNHCALEAEFDITKLSFHAWLLVQEKYHLLDVGAALGRGCGPLVICRKDANDVHRCLSSCTVAVPGEHTTAHLLLRLWRPEIEKRIFMPFDQIMDAVEAGEVDAGVIIHEGRFVYRKRGFKCIEDLGAWWETETGQPIPLGCIAAKKSLGAERITDIEQRLRQSVENALRDPGSTTEYVKAHAQELEDDVIEQHIKTYVNDFTLGLGDGGKMAIDTLKNMAKQAGII